MEAPAKNSPSVDFVIIFDGACNLCSAVVRFVCQRDDDKFRFASLSSQYARSFLQKISDKKAPPSQETVFLIQDKKIFKNSDAILRILKELKMPWAVFFYLLKPLSPFFLDRVYGWVARHRYAWFGKKEVCTLEKEQAYAYRFLN